jgi:hypothetical protein
MRHFGPRRARKVKIRRMKMLKLDHCVREVSNMIILKLRFIWLSIKSIHAPKETNDRSARQRATARQMEGPGTARQAKGEDLAFAFKRDLTP